MTPKRWWLGIGLLILGGVAFGVSHRPSPAALPSKLSDRLEQHAIATAVDTANVSRLERAAAAATAAQHAEALHAAQLQTAAGVLQRRADSLAREAAAAGSARDSAVFFHAALDIRTAERDTLRAELASKNLQLEHASTRGDSLARATDIAIRRATRADSVIAAAVTVVRASDPPCHVARFFSCPSRTAVAIGVSIATAVVVRTLDSHR